MSLEIWLQARHVCERCGEETWKDLIPLGCCGRPKEPRADALYALDCDAVSCPACLGLNDDQQAVEKRHRERSREYTAPMGTDPDGIEYERVVPFPDVQRMPEYGDAA